jgi:tRNA(fMet)-specific endonuclease VapC
MVVLDTDILIDYSKGNKSIIEMVNQIPKHELAITVFTVEEFLYGIYLKNSPDELFMSQQLLGRLKILDYSFSCATKTADLRLQLRKKGQMIERYDLCIASICILNKEPLLTMNKKHFQRIKELDLV